MRPRVVPAPTLGELAAIPKGCNGRSSTRARGKRWTAEDDQALITAMTTHARKSPRQHKITDWHKICKGLPRSAKQCRERWVNYLSDEVRRTPFSEEEDESLLTLYGHHGKKWSVIANLLGERTGQQVKRRIEKLVRESGSAECDAFLSQVEGLSQDVEDLPPIFLDTVDQVVAMIEAMPSVPTTPTTPTLTTLTMPTTPTTPVRPAPTRPAGFHMRVVPNGTVTTLSPTAKRTMRVVLRPLGFKSVAVA